MTRRRSDSFKAVFGFAVFMLMTGHMFTTKADTATDMALAAVGAAIGLAILKDERT